MMRGKFFLLVAAVSVAMVSSSPAQADDVANRVADLYAKGNKLYDQEKWAEAEAAYQAAWDLRPSFDIAGNLGDVEIQLGQYRDAAEHIEYALAEFPAGGKAEARETLKKLLEAAQTQVGSVKITTSIGGAKLVVDGRDVGQAPLSKSVYVDPGKRVFEARLEGYEDALKTVEVEKGKALEVSLVLTPKGGVGRPEKASKPLIIVGAGLGVAGIGTGVALLVVAAGEKTKALELRDSMPEAVCNTAHPEHGQYTAQCDDLLAKVRRKDTFHNVGVGALIAGGVIGAATLTYALWPRKKSSTTGLEVLPVVAPTFAGISASTLF
jgi:hypothetical protein